MTCHGKTVSAFEGGNNLNHYGAYLNFRLDEHTWVTASSNYHTPDEPLPVFDSILQ